MIPPENVPELSPKFQMNFVKALALEHTPPDRPPAQLAVASNVSVSCVATVVTSGVIVMTGTGPDSRCQDRHSRVGTARRGRRHVLHDRRMRRIGRCRDVAVGVRAERPKARGDHVEMDLLDERMAAGVKRGDRYRGGMEAVLRDAIRNCKEFERETQLRRARFE